MRFSFNLEAASRDIPRATNSLCSVLFFILCLNCSVCSFASLLPVPFNQSSSVRYTTTIFGPVTRNRKKQERSEIVCMLVLSFLSFGYRSFPISDQATRVADDREILTMGGSTVSITYTRSTGDFHRGFIVKSFLLNVIQWTKTRF